MPPPPLPSRQIQATFDAAADGDEGLLVVEAPPDSEPTSPLEEGKHDLIGHLELNDDVNVQHPAHYNEEPSKIADDEQPSHHASAPVEDDEGSASSWSAAQEEEARTKSVWLHDNEHS